MLSQSTASRTVTVTHHPGLHARPCLAIVNTVGRFKSNVQIHSKNETADARDILHMMSLGVDKGAEVTLTASGPDADEVLDALARLFRSNFGFAE